MAKNNSHVRELSRPPETAFPQEWYGMATDDHFWMEWRLRAFLELLKSQELPLDRAWRGVEIGCGAGVLRKQLEERSAWTVDGADIDKAALESNPPLRGETLLYDVHDRNPELAGKYDFIVLFDVIEHVPEPGRFLSDCLFLLKPGGWLFVNVPALESMRSAYDEAAGHLRRYDKTSLRAELQAGGAAPEAARYWGLSMLPLLAARRFALKGAAPDEIVRKGFVPPSKPINAVLSLLGRLETSLIGSPPLGTSVMAAARKP